MDFARTTAEMTMNGPISDFFQTDHARLDGLLRQAVAGFGELDAEAFAAFRSGLLRHIALEEKILLPAARRLRGEEPLPVARRLRVDHGAIALLLVPSPTRDLIGEIRSILEPHNRLEEAPDGLYAICDELLSGEADTLLAQVRSYPNVTVAPYHDGARACRSAQDAYRISGSQSALKQPGGDGEP
jgi:hypothetical protein